MKCSEVKMKWNIILDIYFIYLFIIGAAIRGASVKVKHYIEYLFIYYWYGD